MSDECMGARRDQGSASYRPTNPDDGERKGRYSHRSPQTRFNNTKTAES